MSGAMEPARRAAHRRSVDFLLRILLTALHGVLKLGWLLRRPRTFGAHALALTPEGKLILVKLRYAAGWRLPGGGRDERESPHDAVLRELREEIGLASHGEVQVAAELEQRPDHKRDLASLLIVRDVRYRPPRWSWEVEAIAEHDLDDLPVDIAPVALTWLKALEGKL
jgi:8-oxo-dGTP pyrophosphatase MutT (NUDIX family)